MIFLDLNLGERSGYSSTKSVFELIGLIIVCILIFAASYYVTKFVGKKQMGNLKKGNFKAIDTFRISTNKYLQIVQIGKRYALISVTKDRINMLMELSEDDIINRPGEGDAPGFKDILKNITKKNRDAAADSVEAAEDTAEDVDEDAVEDAAEGMLPENASEDNEVESTATGKENADASDTVL